jgi:hypothetical protein
MARNIWYEASSATIEKLIHSLQEIQMSNSCPQIPFGLILSTIRGACNELNIVQNKLNSAEQKIKELEKQIEELKPKA